MVMRGASERLTPILMTAMATALALAPMVIYGGRPGQEIENPMAIVILGGLATSTLMNLFVIPLCTCYSGGKSRGVLPGNVSCASGGCRRRASASRLASDSR
jgi:Cu/Ag efflux pump CusA